MWRTLVGGRVTVGASRPSPAELLTRGRRTLPLVEGKHRVSIGGTQCPAMNGRRTKGLATIANPLQTQVSVKADASHEKGSPNQSVK